MLRHVISIVLAVSIGYTSAQCQEVAASPNVVKISKGTALKLEMLNPINSATARVGDDVPLQLMRPVTAEDVELLPAGKIIHGRITKVRRKTKSRDGLVRWKLDKITFADSSIAPAEIFSFTVRPNANVPDHFSHIPWIRKWCTEEDFTCKDAIVILIVLLPFMPLVFVQYLFSRNETITSEYQLPAHSTVGVALRKDHKVRY